jgi:Protein of unknown function (DUF2970)
MKPLPNPLPNPLPEDNLRAAVQRPASLGQTFKAVAWSFFGVRRSADHAQDVQKLNPLHVVLAGVAGAALFVCAVLLLVRWVVSSGVAA